MIKNRLQSLSLLNFRAGKTVFLCISGVLHRPEQRWQIFSDQSAVRPDPRGQGQGL